MIVRFRLLAMLAAVAVLPVTASGQQPVPPAFKPGLGELMTLIQARHTKLWLAGSSDNWELADYQIDELKEGLEDAAKYVPVYKGLPIADMIEGGILPQAAAVESAVKARDGARFAAAYDDLTAACNACHQSANRGYIVMQRPAASAFPNQSFAPLRK